MIALQAPQTIAPVDDPRTFLETQFSFVQLLIRQVARRHRLTSTELDDFESVLWMHLVKDDYRVLRLFRGDASPETYLRRVIHRQVLDFRTSKWGKWRPSARARRLGREAIDAERRRDRDGCPDAETSAADPWRRRRRAQEVSDRPLVEIPHPHAAADANLLDDEREQAKRRVRSALCGALRSLSGEDRHLLRLRYSRNLTMPGIAASVGVAPKHLYRRVSVLHLRLRTALERDGVCGPESASRRRSGRRVIESAEVSGA